MAYHVDKANGDLVIDGWEEGIADAPEKGIAYMRNINLISIPGEACVNYQTSAISIPTTQVTGTSCTLTASTNAVTWTTGGVTLYTDVAVTFGSTAGGVTAGTVYWISNVQNAVTGSFKVYVDIAHSTVVSLSDASNTFTVITMGQPTYKTLDFPNGYVFLIDANGRAWWVNASGNLTYIGNTTLTSAHGNGICVMGDFIYVFRDSKIDYLPTSYLTGNAAPAWVYNWQTGLNATSGTGYSHFSLVAQDNGIYFCNDQYVGSLLAKGGNAKVDPSNSATFTFNSSALLLPAGDLSTCLAELGTSLLVGGIQNKIYPWDRLSPTYAYPIIVSENYTTRMVTTNSSTYIFAGNRGRIYITNGSNLNLFKKVPDQITNGTDPYFTWLDAVYWKNQIYFSFSTAKNDGTALTTLGGVWALDVSMNIMGTPTSVALRMCNTLSGSAAAYPYVIAPNIRTTTPAGAGLYIGWASSLAAIYGVDVTTSTPYSDFSGGIGGEIYTDLIPTGTLFKPKTFEQIEFKLAEQLVSGEAVRISYRQSYSDAWVVVNSTTAAVLSDIYPVSFQSGQWLQLYVELQSTSSSPSYCRLKEIRVR